MSKLPFEKDAEARQVKHQEDQRVIAGYHLVLVQDPRGQALLKMWRETARTRIPIDSPIQVFAAHEAVRAFVQTMDDYIAAAEKAK